MIDVAHEHGTWEVRIRDGVEPRPSHAIQQDLTDLAS